MLFKILCDGCAVGLLLIRFQIHMRIYQFSLFYIHSAFHFLLLSVFISQAYPHKYPYDWRTKKPTIFRATEQWFASVGTFRADALEAIDKVLVHNTMDNKIFLFLNLFSSNISHSLHVYFHGYLSLSLSQPLSPSQTLSRPLCLSLPHSICFIYYDSLTTTLK